MERTSYLMYGIVAYTIIFTIPLYAIRFATHRVVPGVVEGTLQKLVSLALVINKILLLVSVQCGILLRSVCIAQATKLVPGSLERSAHVVCSDRCSIGFICLWEIVNRILWSVEIPYLRWTMTSIKLPRLLLVFVTTTLVDDIDLFSLRQVCFYIREKAYVTLSFKTTRFYHYLQHSLNLSGVITGWPIPKLTHADFILTASARLYMLSNVRIEVRHLLKEVREQFAAPLLNPLIARCIYNNNKWAIRAELF